MNIQRKWSQFQSWLCFVYNFSIIIYCLVIYLGPVLYVDIKISHLTGKSMNYMYTTRPLRIKTYKTFNLIFFLILIDYDYDKILTAILLQLIYDDLFINNSFNELFILYPSLFVLKLADHSHLVLPQLVPQGPKQQPHLLTINKPSTIFVKHIFDRLN